MTRRKYLDLAMACRVDYLRQVIERPSPYMGRMHVDICRLALRKLTMKAISAK